MNYGPDPRVDNCTSDYEMCVCGFRGCVRSNHITWICYLRRMLQLEELNDKHPLWPCCSIGWRVSNQAQARVDLRERDHWLLISHKLYIFLDAISFFYMLFIKNSLSLVLICENPFDAGWKVDFRKNSVKMSEKLPKRRISWFGAFRAVKMDIHAVKIALWRLGDCRVWTRAAKMVKEFEIFAGDIFPFEIRKRSG